MAHSCLSSCTHLQKTFFLGTRLPYLSHTVAVLASSMYMYFYMWHPVAFLFAHHCITSFSVLCAYMISYCVPLFAPSCESFCSCLKKIILTYLFPPRLYQRIASMPTSSIEYHTHLCSISLLSLDFTFSKKKRENKITNTNATFAYSAMC